MATVPRAPIQSSYSLLAMLHVFSAQCSSLLLKAGRRCPAIRTSKQPWELVREPKAVLALRSGLRFICPGWQGLMLKPWCKSPSDLPLLERNA